jgi:hypothetical protein
MRPTEPFPPPTTYHVGEHTLVLTMVKEQRWSVAVDAATLDASFPTRADAWEAGVRAAFRIDAARTPAGS